VKYDASALWLILEDGAVRLVSRKGNAYKSFDGLCSAIAASIEAESAVLDRKGAGES